MVMTSEPRPRLGQFRVICGKKRADGTSCDGTCKAGSSRLFFTWYQCQNDDCRKWKKVPRPEAS